ncbi:hypothetical protein [Hypericibacter sp.]|uniref:hypothetical protein n=1 Tax=Hypericibacter sp. TaxID=2705401 RepID=UPI003D6C8C2C
MSDIEQLRRRVEAAERHFGTIGEQQGKYRARLIQLMDQIEQRAAERESELNRCLSELQELRRDHDQVKAMLQALLTVIETGRGDALMAAFREMDRKASALVGEGPAGETPFAAKSSADEDAGFDIPHRVAAVVEDFGNGFEDVTPETLASEESELHGQTGIEPASDRFDDVSAETLAAEDIEDEATATGDEIFPEAEGQSELSPEISFTPPTAAQSPVAGIIQRIGRLTRELAEQPTPPRAPAAPVRPAAAPLKRAAS